MEVDLDPLWTWVGHGQSLPVIDEASVVLVRERVKQEAGRVGLEGVSAASIVNVASELAQNQLAHARDGRVVTRAVHVAGQRGLEVIAADAGEGIADVARALEGRPSRPESLGVGLAAVFELADEVDMDVRLGEGTCVWARKFQRPLPQRRRRVGVFGRPFPGERRSGDDAAFERDGDSLVLAVIDGLGHGEPARDASVRAARLVTSRPDLDPRALLVECDAALARTRGAVMTAARIERSGEAVFAGVGNVGARAYGPHAGWRFGGSSFVLGGSSAPPRVAAETYGVPPRTVLVIFSDGVRSTLDLDDDPDLLREHPIVVAQRVVERFARPDDDVTVMVVG